MFFKKDELYVVDANKRSFIGTFSGQFENDLPFFHFEKVIFIDQSRLSLFLKTGRMEKITGYKFEKGSVCHRDSIKNAIHIETATKTDLQS